MAAEANPVHGEVECENCHALFFAVPFPENHEGEGYNHVTLESRFVKFMLLWEDGRQYKPMEEHEQAWETVQRAKWSRLCSVCWQASEETAEELLALIGRTDEAK